MQPEFHYTTVTEAVSRLRENGYSIDFNLEENCISCSHGKFDAEEFEITHVFRYEGNSDPADEATVYGIESKNGLKGILVTGFGASSDSITARLLSKFNIRNN